MSLRMNMLLKKLREANTQNSLFAAHIFLLFLDTLSSTMHGEPVDFFTAVKCKLFLLYIIAQNGYVVVVMAIPKNTMGRVGLLLKDF